MPDLSKFEQMLERLINEDRDGAQELFHDIVVEKSRNIYESLLESDDYDDDDDDDDEDEDDIEEDFNLDEFEVEADDDMMGGDPTDDMISDLGAEDGEDDEVGFDMDMDGEEGEGDVEDRVVDLEDALDELKAEFEKMMSGEEDEEGEEGEEGFDGDEEGYDDAEGDDSGDMDYDDEEGTDEDYAFEAKKSKKYGKKSSGEEMREYVEKVSGGHGAEKKGSGDNGANTKSAVASPNKMGNGTTQNIARSDEYSNGEHAGLGDLNAKDQDAGNINKPGGKAHKAQKPVSKGHGAEKKGSGESGTYDKPIIGGSKKK